MKKAEDKFKRVNLLIRPEQHEMVMDAGLSLSGLVRDLLDDRFSDTTVTLCVSSETRALYDHIVSNFGASDGDLESFFVEALDSFLESKRCDIDELRKELKKRNTTKRS
ncbi:MAG: hypothetical protein KDD66_14875 [Bdellovibrionales bacterium]|nr:hypothetical protein [Bdellovibrionales bacterium]